MALFGTHVGHAFRDREDAGGQLAEALLERQLPEPRLVLALPRGGVPVAAKVADVLHAPLDVLVVRKIGAPFNPEFAMGAIAAGGVIVRDPDAISGLPFGLRESDFLAAVTRERAELDRRERLYRAGRAPLDLVGRTVVLVDDGLATGSTMLAAARAARAMRAGRIVVAAPVGSQEAIERLGGEADEIVVPLVPRELCSIGEWYADFAQVPDAAVAELLA